jgi:uncharacterized protein
MPRPVHFEIHAADPARAIGFYQAVFGWKFEKWGDEPYWIVSTGEGPGIDGGLLPRYGAEPADDAPISAFPATIDVPDLDAAVETVLAAGGSIAVPKHYVQGIGHVAFAKDTEKNLFGLLQPDPRQ